MSPVVIDASAGVEILANSERGRALAGLLPPDAVGWVPEHFFVEVAGVVRHQTIVTRALSDRAAADAMDRLQRWRLRSARTAPLIEVAWAYRHNITMADAVYIALAIGLDAGLLTDDRRLVRAPGLPSSVHLLHLG